MERFVAADDEEYAGSGKPAAAAAGAAAEGGEAEGGASASAAPARVSGARVYVGNLSWGTTWQTLKSFMKQAGEVVYADVFTDPTGRSRGCGIVEFASPEAAATAIAELNDSSLDGRLIFVREDREPARQRVPGAGGAAAAAAAPRAEHPGPMGGGVRGGYGPRGGRGGFRGGMGGGGYGGGYGGRGGRGGGAGGMPRYPDRRGRQVYVGNVPLTTAWQDLEEHFRESGEIIRTQIARGPDRTSRGFATVLYNTAEQAQAAIERFNDTEFQGNRLTVYMDRFA